MNEDTIMRSSVSGRTIVLDFLERESLSGYSQEIKPSEGLKVKRSPVASENLTIGSRIWTFDW